MSELQAVEQPDAPLPTMDDLWVSQSADTGVSPDPTEDAADEAVPASADTTPEPSPEDGPTTDTPEPSAQPDKKLGKPRHDAKARMLDATRKEAEAKRALAAEREQRAALEARLAALEQARRPEPTPEPAQPTGDRFPKFDAWADSHPGADFDDYLEARDAWRDDRVTSRWQAEQAEIARTAQFQARVEAVRNDPTIADALTTYNPQLSPVMGEAMKDSAKVADIVRYLVTHPDTCTQLARETMDVSTPEAVRLMRLHLETLASAAAPSPESAPSARPSSALPPVSRVGGTANATPTAIDDLDFGPEYIRKANEAERKAREARRW